jgi:hypothetical protein
MRYNMTKYNCALVVVLCLVESMAHQSVCEVITDVFAYKLMRLYSPSFVPAAKYITFYTRTKGRARCPQISLKLCRRCCGIGLLFSTNPSLYSPVTTGRTLLTYCRCPELYLRIGLRIYIFQLSQVKRTRRTTHSQELQYFTRKPVPCPSKHMANTNTAIYTDWPSTLLLLGNKALRNT